MEDNFGAKDRFGIFSPVSGIQKDVPIILTLTPDNINVLLKDGKILRRKMREATLLCSSLQIDNCEEGWVNADEANITQTIPDNDYKEGAGSVKWVIGDGLGEESPIAIKEIDEIDLSDYKSINLWIKCDIGTVASGDLQFILGDDEAPIETLDIPVLEADTWTRVNLLLADPSACSAITMIAMFYKTDIGACTIRFDDVKAIEKGTVTDKVQTPDNNPIIHYHTFVRRSDGTEYLLAFTKAHIYHWNPDNREFDEKFKCDSDCENWETVSYNDKVIATNNVDKVLVWDTTGDFVALDTTNGIEYSRGFSNETNVDETSLSDQKVLKVGATTGYAGGDLVIVNRGGDREEECVVYNVQADSLTMIDKLTYEHTANARTNVNADSSSLQKVLYVASTSGFAADEFVTIDADGDRAETRKIYTIQKNVSLTFTVDLYYTHTLAQSDEVVGTLGQQDVVEEYEIYYLTKAKHLIVFENYLLIGNTYENNSYHYQRVRWCAIGEEANWLSGSSGSMEVGQSDKITGFGLYQGFLFVFKKHSYFKVWLVGLPYVFRKIRLSKIIGCKCSHSIVNDSKGRLYFYSSEGTFKEITAGTISTKIQTDIIAKIQPAYVKLIKSAFINETEEIMWSIPVESDKNNKVISFKEGKWLILDLSIAAFGEFKE